MDDNVHLEMNQDAIKDLPNKQEYETTPSFRMLEKSLLENKSSHTLQSQFYMF